jgi:DNA adenine methylase
MPKYRTPLRYPGGKQRLAPFIAEILEANDAIGWDYVEPYAGGAGVAFELLLDRKVGHIHLNDASQHIYALWTTLLGNPDDFCRRISTASLSIDEWKRHRYIVHHPKDHPTADLGFSTFYLNRCNRSGVLTAGVIGGLAQKGRWRIDARFPRTDLIRRIEAIAELANQVTVSNLDAEKFIKSRVNYLPQETLVYCDPPYFERAERLYLSVYKKADHVRLAKFIQSTLKRSWIVSYDSHNAIWRMYAERRKFKYSLQYSALRAYEGQEIFVFSDDLKIPKSSTLPNVELALKYRPSRWLQPAV